MKTSCTNCRRELGNWSIKYHVKKFFRNDFNATLCNECILDALEYNDLIVSGIYY